MTRVLVVMAVLLALFSWGRTARATPIRILVAAGASQGLAADRPLAHTQDDASGVRDVFTALGGVARESAIFVADATRASMLGALDRAEALARQHAPAEVTLLVYFSGHGDRDALHLRGERLLSADLSARVAAIPAAFRLTIIDACRTADASRAKGMQVGPGFAVSLAGNPSTTGAAWIFASADGEAAQESDEIGGAIFTHFWLAGLRGAADANGDRRVTFDEAFSYSYNQTLLRSARSGGVLQRPEAKLALSESSPFVLTDLPSERAELELPREADGLYLVYAVGAQSVVAELYSLADRAVRIALPPGRYIIQKRVGTRGSAVDVALIAGKTRALVPGEFRAIEAVRLAQKGALVVRPWSVEVVDTLLAGSEVDLADDVAVRLSRHETWGASFGPFVGIAKRRTDSNDVTERTLGAELSGDRFFVVSPVMAFRLGIDFRAAWIAQTVRRNDAAHAILAGFPGESRFDAAALASGAHLGARFVVASPLYVDVGLRAMALGARTSSGIDVRLLGGGSLGIGLSL